MVSQRNSVVMSRGRVSRVGVWAVVLALVPVLTAGSAVQERDERRLASAKEAHQRDLDRAFAQYRQQVEQANATLQRQYENVIRTYDRRNEDAAVEQLRSELDALVEASRQPREFSEPGHTQLIEAIGPAVVDSNRRRHDAQRLAELDYVLLYFSASWCGPCQRFNPTLVEFYEEYAGVGNFEVLLVSRDRSEPEMYRYLENANLPFAAIPYDRSDAFRDHYEVRGIPHVIALDPEGEIVARGQANVLQTLRNRIADSE